ncbi:MAG: flagella basal body P-ring formation protein FlgA [Clostridia bacterium]|nr:flagella basal body P-ring formation protein FlgA [Clostridia bacterium]
MHRKIELLLLTLLLTMGIIYGEYIFMKGQIVETPMTTVYFATQSLEAGHLITDEDIEEKRMRSADIEGAYAVSETSLIGNYTTGLVEEGAIIQLSQVSSVNALSLVSRKDNVLVTFEFDTGTSNAWNLRPGQTVRLMFCPEEGENKLYTSVIVVSISDKRGYSNGLEPVSDLQYVTFEVPKDVGYELVSKREQGRIEIIVI